MKDTMMTLRSLARSAILASTSLISSASLADTVINDLRLVDPGKLSIDLSSVTQSPAFDFSVNVSTTGNAGPTFNNRVKSIVYGAGFGHWAGVDNIYISGPNASGQNVARYSQAVNYSAGGSAVSRRHLWSTVSEVRDDSGQDSVNSTGLLAHEIDVIGSGLDNGGTYGRRAGLVIVIGQSTPNPAKPYFVETGLGFGTFDAYSRYKKIINVYAPFTEAAVDLRQAVQLSGNAIWTRTGHRISLNDQGTANLSSDGLNINLSSNATVGSNTADSSTLTLNSLTGDKLFLYTTAGTRRFSSGVEGSTGNYVVGRYSATGQFLGSPLSISFSTGKTTIDSGLKVNGTMNISANTPAAHNSTCTTGDVAWGSIGIYFCASTNSWKLAKFVPFE